MQSTLVDAGPLIALFDKSDRYHKRAVSFLKQSQGLLITTWPVITEVSHMLDFSAKTQINFLKWINRGGLQIFDLEFYLMEVSHLVQLYAHPDNTQKDLAEQTQNINWSLLFVSNIRLEPSHIPKLSECPFHGNL
jgi:predicted nucleic acid-binding protein